MSDQIQNMTNLMLLLDLLLARDRFVSQLQLPWGSSLRNTGLFFDGEFVKLDSFVVKKTPQKTCLTFP